MPPITARIQMGLVRLLRATEQYTKTDMVYLAKGGFWLLLEQMTGIIFSMGLAIAFGHFATKDMYGNYKYILSLAGLLSAISLTGLPDAMTTAVARGHEGALKQAAQMQVRWSLPFVIAACITALYYGWQGNQFVAFSMAIVAVIQPFLGATALVPAFLYAKRNFAQGAGYSIAINAITFGAVTIALLFGERAVILVATFFIVKLLVSSFFYWRAKKTASNELEDTDLFRFTAHLSTMNIVGAVADKLDSVIVFSFLGPAGLATYSFAIAMPEQIKGVAKNLFGIALPKFSERMLSEIHSTVWKKIGYLSFGLTLTVIAYILLAPYIFYYLFPVYEDAVVFSQVYALSIGLAGIQPILYAALYAHKRTKELYVTTTLNPLILIVALIVLVPVYGMWGAIASQIIFRLVSAATVVWQFTHAVSRQSSGR